MKTDASAPMDLAENDTGFQIVSRSGEQAL